MRYFVRGALAVAVVAVLQTPAPAADAPAWPQSKSDIAADPAVMFGSLPNGMRYAIMKNGTPKDEVSIRLRIGAGSLMESDAQQGLAHFLEHMAFRGSTHVPEGNVFEMLQKLGLRTGADANAQTGQTETIYQLDLPRTDDTTIDQGFMLTRDIVGELSLKPEAFDAERGPVLSEERLRAGPGTRTFEAQSRFLLKGQLAPEREPIGKVEIIRNAPVSLVKDFYRDYYRPERAMLVVVGDIDPAAIKAKIESKFSDWNPSGVGRKDPDLGTPQTRGKEFQVFSEAGAPQFATHLLGAALRSDARHHRAPKKNLIENIALTILNQRLAAVAQRDDAPFTSAGASHGNSVRDRQRSHRCASAIPATNGSAHSKKRKKSAARWLRRARRSRSSTAKSRPFSSNADASLAVFQNTAVPQSRSGAGEQRRPRFCFQQPGNRRCSAQEQYSGHHAERHQQGAQ